MHTTSFWLTLGHSLLADLPFSLSERQNGIFGLLYALGSMATLLMMCDRRDLGTAVGERPPSAASEIKWEEVAVPRMHPRRPGGICHDRDAKVVLRPTQSMPVPPNTCDGFRIVRPSG